MGLLGRNGAGKTTLVDMITKVSKPTEGKIVITKTNGVEQSLGICYQHEILYEELTVSQHLSFYAEIKGIENPATEI